MKVTREQAIENRARVVESASQLFREHGFDGIGIADVMKSAGLTHGGFYGQFAGKDELMAEACGKAAESAVAYLNKFAEAGSGDPLAQITQSYLSVRHRDHPAQGCLIAALGPDAARQKAPVRRAFTTGLRATLAALGKFMPGKSTAAKQERTMAHFATMVGGMVLARAVDDPALSKEILDAVSASLLRPAR